MRDRQLVSFGTVLTTTLVVVGLGAFPALAAIEQPVQTVHSNIHDRVAQAATPVRYKSCLLDPAWIRPSEVDQAARLNQLGRYGRPANFKREPYWTNNIFLLTIYGAGAQRDAFYLSGLWTIESQFDRCNNSFDLTTINRDQAAAVVWLLEHRVVSMNWQNKQYVMVVEPVQSGAEFVQFNQVDKQSPFSLKVLLQNSQTSVLLPGNGVATAKLRASSTASRPQPTQPTPKPDSITTQGYGTITGSLSYPADYLPAMKVCAQSAKNPLLLSCVASAEGQRNYQLNVAAGDYFVFSQEIEESTIGDSFRYRVTQYYATSKSPSLVRVASGKTTTGINPNQLSFCTPSVAIANGKPVPNPRWQRPTYCVVAK